MSVEYFSCNPKYELGLHFFPIAPMFPSLMPLNKSVQWLLILTFKMTPHFNFPGIFELSFPCMADLSPFLPSLLPSLPPSIPSFLPFY